MIKKYFLFWLIFLLGPGINGMVCAQKTKKPTEPVYLMPEEKPQFPNGNEGIQEYFAKKMDTRNVTEKAVVTVSLVVTKTGAAQQIYIGKGISPEIDSAVAKVARKMTGWQPGKINGEKVNARVLFPVVFAPQEVVQPTPEPEEPATTLTDITDEVEYDVVEEKRQVYQMVSEMPVFPGGERALKAFLAKNLMYPAADKEKGVRGKVVVQFVVETSGALTEFYILKPLSETANKEALRVMKAMPHWQPGRMNGRLVVVRMLQVFNFPPAGQ